MCINAPVTIRVATFFAVLSLCLGLSYRQQAAGQGLEERLAAEPREALAAAARSQGDPARGAVLFHRSMLTCSACHCVGERPASLGPDLSRIDKKQTDVELVDSILEPSKSIAPDYATVTVDTADGLFVTGLTVEETAEKLVLCEAAQPDLRITVNKKDIVNRQKTTLSLMPAGQMNLLTQRRQFLDLVRYLIDLRDGGAERARQLQPAAPADASRVPDEPLAWQPAVQRGDVAVAGNIRPPRGVALGFTGGTVLFDADRLGTAVLWLDGFVKSSPQNYFGLNWHRAGGAPDRIPLDPHPLQFKFAGKTHWQPFEPPTTSDPNTGSRFDGYQIGKSAVRLRYHVLVAGKRIGVIEDVRAESRPEWQGFSRRFQFEGLPAGAVVGLTLPAGEQHQFYGAGGKPLPKPDGRAPLLMFRSDRAIRVARTPIASGATWVADEGPHKLFRLASSAARQNAPLTLSLDLWTYRGSNLPPTATEPAALDAQPPTFDDHFDLPPKPSRPPAEPLAQPQQSPTRPAVNPRENVDEFPTASGRFLRFVIDRTNDGTAPGLDELEVYGADSKVNLARAGKATASSVISGYPIHQIPHLNDGKLGNPHSWISAENGTGWAQIEFPQPVEISKIVWARDRTGKCRDRLAVAYRIEVSSDGRHWTRVGDHTGRAGPGVESPSIRPDATPGYVMESIPVPFNGCRPSDIAFGEDGTLYAIAMTEGQVWRTRRPPIGQPGRVRWERFASGLHHPIGLAVVAGRIYVAQKPEITELIDRDGDGVADHYRTVATGWGLSTGWHEYTFGLAIDPKQNLWFTLNTGNFWTHPGLVHPGRWRGSIMRVQSGTEKLEEMARGCRTPNGIADGPDGTIFFTDNQGDWVQACKLAQVLPGRFYGHPETKKDALAKDVMPSGHCAVWLPYDRGRSGGVSNSTSGPACDLTGGKFGPFADQWFVGDVGYGANAGILRVALEKVDGEYQGACFRFVDGQPLGCQRMKFGPDQALYMASLTSGLSRLVFDGTTPLAIRSLHIRPQGKGFVAKFTKSLPAAAPFQPADISVKRYHYLYTGNYGSPKTDVKSVAVEDVHLSADRTEMTLTLPVETHPLGMVYELSFGKRTAGGSEPLANPEAWYTVQRIPE